MTVNRTRILLASGLSNVDTVTGYEKRPTAPKPGDAWPIWRGGETDEASGLIVHTWAIAVVLPQDEEAANERLEMLIDAVPRAVRLIAYVDGVAPANLNTDASPVYGLLFTTRSE